MFMTQFGHQAGAIALELGAKTETRFIIKESHQILLFSNGLEII
jgi:hypothetical protein